MAKDIGLRGRMDLTQFNAGVQSFMRSINSMNNEVRRVAKESAAGAASAGKSASLLGVNWQRVKDIVTGVLVIDVFRQISRGLRSIVADALDATAVFQTLQITLEAILARDFAKEWGIPVADALGQITEKAQELLGWVREVAVTTPFSVESLASALAYGQAFGFNVEQSKRLTLATGDFVAGMGLTDQHMQRIIYNFGQMLASGRVLGRELRDLANNFVPIRDITQRLADEAGIPFEEMKKAMKEARVSAQQFIGAFVTLAEEDFAGAMERMARTIRGVQQNISDFIRTLFGLELLGPLMKRIAEIAASALDEAFSPETIRGFAVLGETLLVAFNNIAAIVGQVLIPAIKDFFAALGLGAPTVKDFASAILIIAQVGVELIRAFRNIIVRITEFVEAISTRFNTTFAQIVKNAGQWGVNIVRSLVQGIASAISLIVDVLNQIARLFTYWLRGSSPPKLLPDLPKWGKQAMESWLGGWTSADFGLFNDIARVVASFVRSLAHQIPETSIVPRILGARKEIERAINDVRKFGDISEASIRKITNSVKAASGPLKDFIRESFQFAKISAIFKEVQKVLDFDFKFDIPVEILGQTVRYTSDLIKLARRFKGELGAAVRDYVDALEDVRLSTERVSNAQKSLNDLTEKYSSQLRILRAEQDKLSEREDITGRVSEIEAAIATGLLTDEEKRRLELEKQEILLEHRVNAVENERDIALDAARKKLDAEEEIARVAEDRLERQRKLVEVIADEQLASAKEQLEAARAAVQLQIDQNNLVQEQVKLLERLAKAAGEGQQLEIPGLDFEGFADDIENSLQASKDAIAQAVEDLRADIFRRVRSFIEDLFSPFEGVSERLSELFGNISGVFLAAQQDPAIQGLVASVKTFIGDLRTVFENLREFWEENGPGISALIGDFFTRLVEVIPKEEIFSAIGDALESFGDFLVTLSQQLVENGPQIQESLRDWIDWVFDEGIPKLVEFAGSVRDKVLPVLSDLLTLIRDNAPTIIALLTALGGAFLSIRPALTVLSLLSKASFALLPIIFVFQTLSGVVGTFVSVLSTIGGVVGPVLGAIAGFIIANLAPIIAIVVALIGVFIAFRDDVFGLRTALVNAFASVRKAVEPALGPLREAFEELRPALNELKKTLAPIGRALVGVLKVIGTIILGIVVPAIIVLLSFISGLARGFLEGFTAFVRGLKDVFEGVVRFIEGVKDIFVGFGQFIAGIFRGDTELIKEGLTNILGGVREAFLGLFDTVIGLLKALVDSLVGFLLGFVRGVGTFITSLFDSLGLSDKILDVLRSIQNLLYDMQTNVRQAISNVVTTIAEFYYAFYDAGVNFMINLIEGISSRIFGPSGIVTRFRNWVAIVISSASEKFSDFLALGRNFIINLMEGIRQRFEGILGVYERFKTFIQNTIDKVAELKDQVIQAGKDFVAGFIEGIVEKAVDLYKKVVEVVQNAISKAKIAAGIQSDSKVMHEVGIDFLGGFIGGILSQASTAEKTVSDIFTDLISIPEGMQIDLSNLLSNVDAIGDLSSGMDVRHLFDTATGAGSPLLTQPATSQTNIQNITVEMHPTYNEVQSEASVYYDVQAALAHITR